MSHKSLYRGGWLDRLKLYCLPKAVVGKAYPHAVETVQRLQAAGIQPVFVSARQEFARRNTVHWLQAHGLDTAQLHLSPVTLPEQARAGWKSSVISTLQQNHQLQAVAGVGDRPSDLQAYVDSGIRAVGVMQGSSTSAGQPSSTCCTSASNHAFKDGATNALQPHEQLAHVYSMLSSTESSRLAVTLHVLCTGAGGEAPPFHTRQHSSMAGLWAAVEQSVLDASAPPSADR